MATREEIRKTDNSKLGRAVLNDRTIQSRHRATRIAVTSDDVKPVPVKKKTVKVTKITKAAKVTEDSSSEEEE